MSTRLQSQIQIAMRRASALKAEERKSDWRRRMDPAAYTCRREGASWIAEGPAGQRFDYSRTEHGNVLCISASGGIYLLTPQDDGSHLCDCRAREQAATCKHEVGFRAAQMSAQMERQERSERLRREAAELNRLRAEAEDAARAMRAEAGAADISVAAL